MSAKIQFFYLSSSIFISDHFYVILHAKGRDMKKMVFLFVLVLGVVSCKTEKIEPAPAPERPQFTSVASPPAIIYKMKRDYSQNVPVLLSVDKQTIASYPHPRDLYLNGKLATPTQLQKGYWLDNRGINENVAFLKFTYEEYAAMGDAPSMQELKESILDDSPIKEMWNCGPRHRFNNIVDELNEWILTRQLDKKCTRIK